MAYKLPNSKGTITPSIPTLAPSPRDIKGKRLEEVVGLSDRLMAA